MTTPPTPAGWYPDPDGSAGLRYWDGSAWTDHRSPPAAPPEPEPPSPPAGGHAVPSEQPTTVVPTRSAPTEGRVGAHRRPDPEDEPTASVPFTAPEPFTPAPEPFTPAPEPAAPAPVFADPTPAPFTATAAPEPTTPEPVIAAPAPEAPSAPGDNRRLVVRYTAACAALLAVLLLVVIYGVFINKNDSVQISAPPTSTSSSAAPTTSGNGETSATETATETPTTAPAAGGAADGPVSFTVHGVEIGTTVTSPDAPVEKTAQGEFVIVHMTVTNTSDAPATFLGTLQTLTAGGSTYNIDDEATFYVGGGIAELAPGAQADVAVAYDVPPGTVPESIDLHGEPLSPGVQVPLP